MLFPEAKMFNRNWLGSAGVKIGNMWQQTMDPINESAFKYSFFKNGVAISFVDAIESLKYDDSIRSFVNSQLQACPFKAFRWENPPLTKSNANRPFEFVVLDCGALDRKVDKYSFSEKFELGKDVVTFPNLRGDASLVVPCPIVDDSIYGHLGSFVRNAPENQIHELWKVTAHELAERIGDEPVWLSTAGMGVSWLHIRLDSRPKYYAYAPYRNEKAF